MNYQEFHKQIFEETARDVVSYSKQGIRESIKILIFESDLPVAKKKMLIKQADDINISEEQLYEYVKYHFIEEGIISQLLNLPSKLSRLGSNIKQIARSGRETLEVLNKMGVDYAGPVSKRLGKELHKAKGPLAKSAKRNVKRLGKFVIRRPVTSAVIGVAGTVALGQEQFVIQIGKKFFLIGKDVYNFIANAEKEYVRVDHKIQREWSLIVENFKKKESLIHAGIDLSGLLPLVFKRTLMLGRLISFDVELDAEGRKQLLEKHEEYVKSVAYYEKRLKSLLDKFDETYKEYMLRPTITKKEADLLYNVTHQIAELNAFTIDQYMGYDTNMVEYFASNYQYYLIGSNAGLKEWDKAYKSSSELMDRAAREYADRVVKMTDIYAKVETTDVIKSVEVASDKLQSFGDTAQTWRSWFMDVFKDISSTAYAVQTGVASGLAWLVRSPTGRVVGIGTALALIALAAYYIWRKYYKKLNCDKLEGNERINCEIEVIDKTLNKARSQLRNCQNTPKPRECIDQGKELLRKWQDRKFELMNQLSEK